MVVSAFIKPEEIDAGTQPIQRPPGEIGELYTLGLKAFRTNNSSTARELLILEEEQKNRKLINGILGRDIKPEDASDFEPFESIPTPDRIGPIGISKRQIRSEIEKIEHDQFFLQQAIDELKASDPEKFADVKTREQIIEAARERANISSREFAEASKRSTFLPKLAGLVGGFAGAATDPMNLLGAFGTGIGSTTLAAGKFLSTSLLKTALREAGANVAVEAIQQPDIARWQRELGNEYGFREISENLGFAALFGAAFPIAGRAIRGIGRNARPAASWIFSQIAEAPGLPSRVKTAANYLSRSAFFKENNPHIRRPNVDNLRAHYESIQITADAFARGEKVDSAALKVSEADILNIDTKPRRGDTQIIKSQLSELERFQRDSTIGGALPKQAQGAAPQFNLDTLPQQILDKAARKRGNLTTRDFLPEEQQMLKSAGITPNAKSQIKKESLINQRQQRENAGQLRDLSGKEIDHIRDYRSRINDSTIANQDLDKQVSNIESSIRENQRTLENKIDSPDVAEQLTRDADTPERIQAEQEAFDALLRENPNLQIVLDDRTVTLRQLVEEFANDERALNEIRSCGLG